LISSSPMANYGNLFVQLGCTHALPYEGVDLQLIQDIARPS